MSKNESLLAKLEKVESGISQDGKGGNDFFRWILQVIKSVQKKGKI
ncbi:hypothetical protein OHD16_15655 [Sphingobacterium sp. ML3W]|nr:hypothetical protein [Sphingobacterium sp. ML3W]WFA81390.1 hypothetical protein OGI71_08795 [Sphingobacterium sp. ML3W]